MPEFSRRQFLTMMAATAAGAVAFSGCTPFPSRNEFLTESPGRVPEDTITGGDNWYATICRECPAGCGAIVRVFQGRALKVEGNPEHPINRGALCSRGQAAVQALYHPDRYRVPLRRAGDRGSGKLEQISWDEALADLLDHLRGVTTTGQRALLVVTEPLSGHRADVVQRLVSAFGAQHLPFQTLPAVVEAEAIKRVFGQDRLPYFDIARAKYLLSFGADFLGTWLSPVQYGRAYGEFRQGRPDRGYFVQVEPYLSQTGTNADEWIPIRPGTEGVLALSIAQVLVSTGSADPVAAGAVLGAAGASSLDAYTPDRASQIIGITAERISTLARAFASQRPALAIGGDRAAAHTNGLFNLTAIYLLNVLVGNVGKEGGVLPNPPSPVAEARTARFGAPLIAWQKLAADLRSGQGQPKPFGLALIHGANPVYGLPGSLRFAESLGNVPYIVSFSNVPDETTQLADLILPDHTPLETWGDEVPNPGPGVQAIGLQQPVVNPLYDTRDYLDVLLSLAPALGLQRELPWASFREVVRAGAQQLQAAVGGTQKVPFEQFWNGLLQRGGWWASQAAAPTLPAPVAPPTLPAQPVLPDFAGAAHDYPFHLQVFPHIAVGAGELAYLPWLQSTPDPMTTVAWRTWVQINPKSARELGVALGDIVAVESPEGSIEAAVYPYPATGPDVVALPLGQGHTSNGRWADKVHGANPLEILAPLMDRETGGLAWAATRVRIRKTGKNVRIPVYEGDAPAVEPEPGSVVKVIRQAAER